MQLILLFCRRKFDKATDNDARQLLDGLPYKCWEMDNFLFSVSYRQ